ncbi:hypothetical protein [Sphingomonas sp. M1-B02]|uniref:hypothetical protein n=1 Tax=Sphingomonas sp. M1-B02 TaxID=3114300 RepID=UPI00223F6CB7|nr:hypothetical protein [Sphingomonas sp. S6-11]UZK66114.1 hypothetical protein OKW87_16645 [Sphingomonas sp. S6-11]
MLLMPMNVPAAIHRRCERADTIVAEGPLLIMAHGLMALAPENRADCWISTKLGNLMPHDAEIMLRNWDGRQAKAAAGRTARPVAPRRPAAGHSFVRRLPQ